MYGREAHYTQLAVQLERDIQALIDGAEAETVSKWRSRRAENMWSSTDIPRAANADEVSVRLALMADTIKKRGNQP